MAEDAAQEACALALVKWPAEGMPDSPGGWLAGVARHKVLDQMRREARRPGKEAAAMRDPTSGRRATPDPPWPEGLSLADGAAAADELGLIFMCCHPALDPAARIALTLRSVCGLDSKSIATAFIVPEPTVAQRIVRAKRKIRQAGIRLRVPDSEELPGRLAAVLRVVYLVYTQGHLAASGPELVRGALCDQAMGLARALAGRPPCSRCCCSPTRGGTRAPAMQERWCSSPTRTAHGGTARRSPKASSCLRGHCARGGPGHTSCTPRSPPATPARPARTRPTGGRSPRCTGS